MKTNNQTNLSLISKTEWWLKKLDVNSIRGTFDWNQYQKYLKALQNNEKKCLRFLISDRSNFFSIMTKTASKWRSSCSS